MPVNSADRKRLEAAYRLVSHIHERFGLDFAIELWDGSRVPAGADGVRLRIGDEGVIASLIRSPRLDTIIRLYAVGRIDIAGGSLFDIAERRPTGKTKRLIKSLDKGLLARSALKFAFRPAGSLKLDIENGVTDHSGSSRGDIERHYDLSNAFYELFLDPELVYSCAYFPDWEASLERAQIAKLDHICRKLRLEPGERMLDIGCGWGALACHAALNYGVHVHGVTLSEQQYFYAREKVAALDLRDRVEIELIPYQDVDGAYDKIASVGMFEHVGFDHHQEYFRHIHGLLRDRGLYLHHAITRRAKLSDRAFRRKRPEYQSLVRFIFAGGEVDHIGHSLRCLEANGFEVHDVEGLREHYARTTRLWAERLDANREAAITEVGAERTRLWLAYLTGVSLAFSRGTIGIFQTVASKRSRGPSGLPPTRADLYRPAAAGSGGA